MAARVAAGAFQCAMLRPEIASWTFPSAGRKLAIREEPRREGDPPTLIAAAGRVHTQLGWQPRLDDLDTIVASALRWEEKLLREPW